MSKNIRNMSVEEFAKIVSERIHILYSKSQFKTKEELINFINEKNKNISSATISVLFSGTHNISAHNLAVVIEALNGSADRVIFGKEQIPLLTDFQEMLDQVRQKSVDISDDEIKEIILLLTEKKQSKNGTIKTIKRLLRTRDDKKIDAIINLIEIMLAEGEK